MLFQKCGLLKSELIGKAASFFNFCLANVVFDSVLCLICSSYSLDGDRSQEWAIKAAMWAQQRQLHSQMQQNHPPDTGQTQPPPPEVTNNPPLPSENAPTQPPPPDAINNASAFVHKERLDLLEGGSQGNDPSSPWNNQHNDQHQSGLIQQQAGQGHRKGHWKPIGGSAFDDSERPFDNNYEQGTSLN